MNPSDESERDEEVAARAVASATTKAHLKDIGEAATTAMVTGEATTTAANATNITATATVGPLDAAAESVVDETASGFREACAQPGEFSPLELGSLSIWPPVVLAPMAGVTDVTFRSLCRQYSSGLFVNQMITARAFLERDPKTLKLAEFAPDESPRSAQLYGIMPAEVGECVRRLVDEDGVDHIDMNFGCPVPKVTRHGGGAALPIRYRLLERIIAAAVKAAGDIPVTIKFRLGVDDDNLTFIQTGLIAEAQGCAAVSLHARTAFDLYSGAAKWERIGELKQAVRSIPVLGNGDIWEPADALAMMRETGCDGVVIGRGCLGRPWLFGAMDAAFSAKALPMLPNFGEVADLMVQHAQLLLQWHKHPGALRQFRKHALWYVMGFPLGGEVRGRLARFTTIEELKEILDDVDRETPFPVGVLRQARSHTNGPRQVHLPEGWLDNRDCDQPPSRGAESIVSGG